MTKAWAARHPDRALAYQRAYGTINRAKLRARGRAYYAANRDRVLAMKRAWNARNRTTYEGIVAQHNMRRRGAPGTHTPQEWREKKELFGNCCVFCGESKSLEREHNVPISRGGTNDISNILPACRNCNAQKHSKTAREFIALRTARMGIV